MSYELKQPYTEKERTDFIVKYNHGKGLAIEEGVNGALFALEPWEKLVDGEIVDNKEEYDAEQALQERERISMLFLTAADVERAIYKAKGMDFEDILQQLGSYEAGQPGGLDLKALKIELKANHFYRGNPYIEQVGAILGYTPEDLDYLFINGVLPVKEAADNA